MTTPLHELSQEWRDEERGRENELIAKKHAAELEAALADQWQPIETAPKRVTLIIGDFDETGSGWQNDFGQWFVYGTRIPMKKPTHWMPLPAAPTPPKP